jgi:hypothetical protein
VATGSIYIRSRGKTYGPYKEEELSEHVSSGRVSYAAWIFLHDSWRALSEIEEVRKVHPDYEARPTIPPLEADAAKPDELVRTAVQMGGGTVSADPVWFVIRDKKKFGPYSSADIVSQVQRKELDGTAFVWRPGFATWQRISQVNEFSRDSMKRLASDGTPLDILVKRKFRRAPYEVEVVAHDNTRAIEGKTMMMGEGGLFLATPRPAHRVGARLKLHFREGDHPSFNAVAEVVSVVRGDTPGYCMRFVALSDADRRRIARFVTEPKKEK